MPLLQTGREFRPGLIQSCHIYITWENCSGQNKGLIQAQNRKITMTTSENRNFFYSVRRSSISQHRLSCSAGLTLHLGSNVLKAPLQRFKQLKSRNLKYCRGSCRIIYYDYYYICLANYGASEVVNLCESV